MILKTNPLDPNPENIAVAADAIKRGELVAFPTETVYGLGADATNSVACSKIFEAKGRPNDNPLIVHVCSLEMADKFAHIPEEFRHVIERIWPSPITFIVNKKRGLSDLATAGLDTVGLRMPAHKIALKLIEEAGVPLAAPSANKSGRPSPTTAGDVIEDLDDSIGVVLDGGPSFFGVESTIIDLRSFTVVRPGPFTPEEIAEKFGRTPLMLKDTESLVKPISPGLKYRHYAPVTPLFLFAGDVSRLKQMSGGEKRIAFLGSEESCSRIDSTSIEKIAMGSDKDLYSIARNLFGSLRKLDELHVNLGLIEPFEEGGIGFAIMNRVRKAAGGRTISDSAELASLSLET
jgi:L-threonylcarbamoyladenylate synthase